MLKNLYVTFSVLGEAVLCIYGLLCASIVMAFASKLLKIINDAIIIVTMYMMYLALWLRLKNIHGVYVFLELYSRGWT